MKNTKIIHILLIIVGSIFILMGAFHENIWFDESYSVSLASNHSLAEIWSIGGHDVHPVFYYWMLKIVSLVFGNSILAYRLISALAIVLLSVLGYTHIKRDFGEKVRIVLFVLCFLLTNKRCICY